jgi:hypothetical protein
MPRRKPEDLISNAIEDRDELKAARVAEEAASLKRKSKRLSEIALESESRLESLLAISGAPAIERFTKMKRSHPDGVAVIVPATDWHVEERIFPDAVNGKNNFNLQEASFRIRRFYNKIVELVEWQQHLAPVAELWHPLLGDLMTGYIHEELAETNQLSPVETCVFLRDEICSGIDFLLKETKLPVAIPTCVGNHGRTTQKMRIKTSCRNSYEWLLYKTLEKIYEGHNRVSFQVGSGYHNVQTILGRKVRFHHGDGLRYNGGVGGITIPVNKSIAQWDKVDTCDFDIFGHWHTFLSSYPKWISCGSLMGYSEFSLSIKAEFQHPTQTFIVIDRRYGMTLAAPIFLTTPTRS